MDKYEKRVWLGLLLSGIVCATSFATIAGVMVRDSLISACPPMSIVEERVTPISLEDEGVEIIDATFLKKRKKCPPVVSNVQAPIINTQTQTSSIPTSVKVELNNLVTQVNTNDNKLQAQIDALEQAIKDAEGKPGPKGDPGDAGAPGPAGPPGKDGPTVEEVLSKIDLTKLKGADGKPGENGKVDQSTIDLAVNNYIQQHQNELKGAKGDQGPAGKDGVVDANGDGILDELPPIYVKVKDPKGTYSTPSKPVYLGEQMNLVLIPTSTTGVSGGVGVEVEGTKGGT